MNKIYVQNLGLILTNKCNLDCKHCSRGCKNNKDMKKEVIDKVLSECRYITNLALLGGEVTLSCEILEYLINYIVDNHIIVEELTTIINGTNYSDKFIELLDYLEEYIKSYNDNKNCNTTYTISVDDYHLDEIERLSLQEQFKESVTKYSQSIHFYGFQYLKANKKLFRQGNAEKLSSKITIPLRKMKYYITYAGNPKLCNVGPLVTINTDGIYTECDASIINQETIYNYGNVLDMDVEQFVLKYGKKVRPNMWNIKANLETRKYQNYNK